MSALKELEQLAASQTTVRTSKLKPLIQDLAVEIAELLADKAPEAKEELERLIKEVQRKENLIVRLQNEAKEHANARKKHKSAMQDYENLKKRNSRLQDEYNILLAARNKDKEKKKKVDRELTETQVKLAAATKKLKKAGIQ